MGNTRDNCVLTWKTICKKTSVELIDMLADMGFGKPYKDHDDKRRAFIAERGVLRDTIHYVDIVVIYCEDEHEGVFDYTVKLIVPPYEFD